MTTETPSTDEVLAATQTILVDLGFDPDAVRVTVHAAEQPTAAAVLDADGVVVGVELVDAAAVPERDDLTFQLLDDSDRGHAVVGARFADGTWQPPAPPPAADAPVVDVQAQLDALTALICEAQLGAAPPPGTWSALLAAMIDRGAARAETIDGAHQTWHVLEDDEHDVLRARLDARGAAPAAVEDLLDASNPADAGEVPAPRRTRGSSGGA